MFSYTNSLKYTAGCLKSNLFIIKGINRNLSYSPDSSNTLKAPTKTINTGLQSSLHGSIYQLKLLMLFLLRGVNNNYSFRLSTENEQFGKFNDISFEYDNQHEDRKIYRCVQAIHLHKNGKKISRTDLLLQRNGDFSIQKYFLSCLPMIRNPKLSATNRIFKDFVICTNIDLDKSLHKDFVEVKEKDKILNMDDETSKLVKIAEGELRKELVPILKSSSEIHQLTKRLAQKPKLNLTDDLFKHYQPALVKEALEFYTESGKFYAKFRKDFLEDPKFSNFRNFFLKYSPNSPNEDFLRQWNIEISKGFLNVINDSVEKLPDDIINSVEIDDFLEKLVFAVNQPNETELGEIINKEISNFLELPTNDSSLSHYQQEMLHWMKSKNTDFMTRDDGKKLFENIRKKLIFRKIIIEDEIGVCINQKLRNKQFQN